MASVVPVVLLLLFPGLFTMVIGYEDCGINKHQWLVCGYLSSEFCCGNCKDRYCCKDPQKRFTEEARDDCVLKNLRNIVNFTNPTPANDADSVAVITSILGFVAIAVVVILCWVSPWCLLYKKCRNPQSLTTVVTTQFLPHPLQSGQYPPYQPLKNDSPNGEQLTPIGDLKGQPCVLGQPPLCQDAAASVYPNGDAPPQPAYKSVNTIC